MLTNHTLDQLRVMKLTGMADAFTRYCQVNQICAFITATSGIPEGPRPHSVAVSHERFPLS